MEKETVLVTGGCGFIGSNLVDELINKNFNVVVIDNKSSDAHDSFYFNDKAIYYDNDISESSNSIRSLNGIFLNHKPKYVFHLAAEARIQNCIYTPTKAFKSNALGTQHILEASKLSDVKRVMFSSTSAIYGLSQEDFAIVDDKKVFFNTAQRESSKIDCLNMYSYSKLFGEYLCKLYSEMYNLDTVCFRYFNVYGPRQPVRGSYAPVIGVFSRQKKNNEAMTVVGDGLQTRDYVHVSDVVSANISAMNRNEPLNGEIINIGTCKSFSVLDIAKMMGGEYIHIPPRSGEAKNTLADISKAEQLLGWKPTKLLEEYMEKKEYDN
jgi:UDP-glucose 4-epimerase